MGVSINFNSSLPFIDANLAYFQQQIQAGTTDGSIVSSEQQVLNQELSQIQQTEAQDEKGTISSQETQQLWTELGQMNNDLYGLRNNSLGTVAGQNAYPNGEPQLITAQNFWNNPDVNQGPDFSGPAQPYPSIGGTSSVGNMFPSFNSLFTGFDSTGSPNFANASGFNQQLSSLENFQSQQLSSSQGIVNMFQPSALGTALTMIPGFLTFMI